MAADPFAFYRGSACVFYADVAARDDRWADERTSRVWIQGDLHAENFGTYMDGSGVLIFDVNDFDEAYVGHFTWDLKRFAASVALMCWQKALSDEEISELIDTFARAYADQIKWFLDEADFELLAEPVHRPGRRALHWRSGPLSTRSEMLNRLTRVDKWDRQFREISAGVRRLDDDERAKIESAFERYLQTIPRTKRYQGVTYDIKDVVGKRHGIGSAGLPTYTVLIEGFNQALDNDAVLSVKQDDVARRGASSTTRGARLLRTSRPPHRSLAARAAGPCRPAARPHRHRRQGIRGQPNSRRTSQISTGAADRARRTRRSRRATGPCGDQGALRGRHRQRPVAGGLPDRGRHRRGHRRPPRRIRRRPGDFGLEYAAAVRDDHRHFVEAFREGRIPASARLERPTVAQDDRIPLERNWPADFPGGLVAARWSAGRQG